MKVSEAAEKAGVSAQTIYRWCRDGKIEAEKEDKSWSIDSEGLESFLAERKSKKKKEDENMSNKEKKESTSGFSSLKGTMSDLTETQLMQEFLKNRDREDNINLGEILKYNMIRSLVKEEPKPKPQPNDSYREEIKGLRQEVAELKKEKKENKIVSEISSLRDDLKEEKKKKPVSIQKGSVSESDLRDLKNEIKDMISEKNEKKGTDWGEIVKAGAPILQALIPPVVKGLQNQGVKPQQILDMVFQAADQMSSQSGSGDFGGIFDKIIGALGKGQGQQQTQQKQQQIGSQQIEANQIGQYLMRLVDQYDTPQKVVDGIVENVPIQRPDDAIPAIVDAITQAKGEDFGQQVADGLRERYQRE